MFITPNSAAPMQSLDVSTLVAGVGIEGDRYALNTGTYSFQSLCKILGEPGRHVTMVSRDGVEAETAKVGMEPFDVGPTLRRNLVLRGISSEALNAMVGHEVVVGASVRLFVHRRTVPCKYREAQSKRTGMMDKLWDVCGVNCEILCGGDVRIGDSVALVPDTYQPTRINIGHKPPHFFVRPSERTLAQVREMAIPSLAIKALVAVDPRGSRRLQDAYASAGVYFFPQQEYDAAVRFRAAMDQAACVSAFVTAIAAVGLALTRRKSDFL